MKQERKEGQEGRKENKLGSKCDVLSVPPAEIFGKLAGEHSTVRAVHLLGNVLK